MTETTIALYRQESTGARVRSLCAWRGKQVSTFVRSCAESGDTNSFFSFLYILFTFLYILISLTHELWRCAQLTDRIVPCVPGSGSPFCRGVWSCFHCSAGSSWSFLVWSLCVYGRALHRTIAHPTRVFHEWTRLFFGSLRDYTVSDLHCGKTLSGTDVKARR